MKVNWIENNQLILHNNKNRLKLIIKNLLAEVLTKQEIMIVEIKMNLKIEKIKIYNLIIQVCMKIVKKERTQLLTIFQD
jgi:hypothetical protein